MEVEEESEEAEIFGESEVDAEEQTSEVEDRRESTLPTFEFMITRMES